MLPEVLPFSLRRNQIPLAFLVKSDFSPGITSLDHQQNIWPIQQFFGPCHMPLLGHAHFLTYRSRPKTLTLLRNGVEIKISTSKSSETSHQWVRVKVSGRQDLSFSRYGPKRGFRDPKRVKNSKFSMFLNFVMLGVYIGVFRPTESIPGVYFTLGSLVFEIMAQNLVFVTRKGSKIRNFQCSEFRHVGCLHKGFQTH